MRHRLIFAGLAGMLLSGAASAGEDSVTRYRLAADTGNSSRCHLIDPALARLHTITVKHGDVQITSAGGIEGRMKEIKPEQYGVVFELSGLSLDVLADLSPAHRVLSVEDRQSHCRWQAEPE
jgi:hypothetical protein